MKKLLLTLVCVALVSVLVFTLFACNGGSKEATEIEMPAYNVETVDYSDVDFSNIKVGLICLHDENSTYDKNFIQAMERAQADLGLTDDQVIIATGIPEGDACYQKAVELAEAGCDVIFADSFGHENYIMRAAAEYPNVQFCHATGTKAHTSELTNYGNAFASIYEGRYLAGVAAGLKLVDMYGDADGKVTDANAKIGYIGAYTYAEVMSGYTSFFLGVKSQVPNVTMDVTFTGSWYDETAENNAAKALINRGCKLISQHADSMGAPNACEEAGIPNVSYNGSTIKACPESFIISSAINWTPYYEYVIASKVKGEAVAKDWTGTIATGSVVLTNINGDVAAPNTVATLVSIRNQLANGTLKVFDTSKFTVNGETLTSYLADIDDDGSFSHETEVIADGYFHESEYRSAPAFDLEIDGITLLDRNYGD